MLDSEPSVLESTCDFGGYQHRTATDRAAFKVLYRGPCVPCNCGRIGGTFTVTQTTTLTKKIKQIILDAEAR